MSTDPHIIAGLAGLVSLPRHRWISNNPLTDHIRASIQFDTISVVGLDIDGYRFDTGLSLDTDMPPALVEAYYGENLFLTDPLVRAAQQARDLITEAEAYDNATPPDRLLDLCRTFSVMNRTVVPIRRADTVYGAVCVSRSKPLTQGESQFLSFISPALHEAMTAAIMVRFAPRQLRLTRDTLRYLEYASHGQTNEEIAAATGVTVDKVNWHIKRAIRILGAGNRAEAVAEAIRRRLIA